MPLDKKRSLPTLLGRVNKTPLTSVVSAVTAEGQSFEKTFPITTATASLEGTATAVSIMSQETTYFLVPASGGLCIRPQNNSVYTCNVEGKEDQQWTAEKGEGDKIAFRNATGKQYLRAKSGNNSGQVVLGQRQWWKLENSKTPGAFWYVSITGLRQNQAYTAQDQERRLSQIVSLQLVRKSHAQQPHIHVGTRGKDALHKRQ